MSLIKTNWNGVRYLEFWRIRIGMAPSMECMGWVALWRATEEISFRVYRLGIGFRLPKTKVGEGRVKWQVAIPNKWVHL